jgi:hypothetical protein
MVADVVEKVKPFERAAAVPKRAWVAPLGVLLLGGGIGALLAGKGMDYPILASLLIGAGLIFASRLRREGVSENLDAICDDLREYLERWPIVADQPLSPEYERLVKARKDRNDPNVGIWKRAKNWWL